MSRTAQRTNVTEDWIAHEEPIHGDDSQDWAYIPGKLTDLRAPIVISVLAEHQVLDEGPIL